MPDSTNGKVSIKQLYDEIIPMIEDIASMKTDMSNIKKDIGEIKTDMKNICTKNDTEHRDFVKWEVIKNVSILVGILIGLATIWNTITAFM